MSILPKSQLDAIRELRKSYRDALHWGHVGDLLNHINDLERRLAIAETAIVDLLDKSADSIDTDEYPGLVQALTQIRQGREEKK